ncbi:MAG TPA: hypothetical protein VFY25_04025 [Anaerolineales bacterium]|nr:hypothetical protein [Anaerolineales bacterium]
MAYKPEPSQGYNNPVEYWMATSPWPGVILWVILYLSDYYLTVYSARGFGQISHFQFEVFELTPLFQKEVRARKPVSRVHITLLIVYSLLIVFLWWFMQRLLFFPWTYLLYLGMFLLLEVAVHFRHFRNISLIREIKRGGGIEGQISYRKWLSYRISALEFYTFSALFLFVAILNSSPFFLGGAVMCLATGFKHNRLARKAKTDPLQVSEIQS